MRKMLSIIIASFSLILFFSCKTPATGVAGNYIYKTECLGNKMDGTVLLKAWGWGKDKNDAIEQAQKNALRTVLFNGVTEGKTDCEAKPLITEVNAEKKNETYFEGFFAKKNKYSNYIDSETSKKHSDVKAASNGITVGIVVSVFKSKLKDKMVEDGIIK